MQPWQRLSDRDRDPSPVPVLHEGVPGHLEAPLREWISRALQSSSESAVCAALRLGITVGSSASWSETARFLGRRSQPHELLDIVDATLACDARWKDSQSSGQRRAELAAILRDGSSAWRINDDFTGLTRRVDATAAAAATEAERAASALPTAGSAAAQLAGAWAALYQLHPDPSAAYRDAIRAVESAAHAVIEPNNATATLGTMLGQLRNASHIYKLLIAGPNGNGSITPLIAMLELLWTGQTSRHGGQAPTRPEIFEEAQMAVHLAATLVHWFTTGAVTRR